MKIAIITDIHHGPLSHNKKAGWSALPVVDRFVDHARAIGADLLLDLGDHISDTTREADRAVMAEVVERLARFEGERVHVLGNHDVANLSIEDNEEIFGSSMRSRVVDLGALRLIAWQPDVRLIRGKGFNPAQPHLEWLVEALLADERPAIIATHVPVSGHSQVGNYYFEGAPEYATYPDHAEVRRAVEETGRAAMWLSGHVHWNTLTNVRNVKHITVQSLSERFTTGEDPAEAFAELEIADGRFALRVHGNDPIELSLPFHRSADRPWIAPRSSARPAVTPEPAGA